jgi:predicted  nucleic acid-binding Zn-ribbon protein
MVLTEKDLKKLSSVFATKEDLKSFATKEDLNKLALDLAATKSDLKSLAGEVKILSEKVKNLTAEVKDLTAEMHARFNEVTNTLDWLVKAIKDMKEDLTIRFAQYRRHDEQLEDHEKTH